MSNGRPTESDGVEFARFLGALCGLLAAIAIVSLIYLTIGESYIAIFVVTATLILLGRPLGEKVQRSRNQTRIFRFELNNRIEQDRLDKERRIKDAMAAEHADRARVRNEIANAPERLINQYRTAVEHLENAQDAYDKAVEHRHASAFTPFWKEIERGVNALIDHRTSVETMDREIRAYTRLLANPHAKNEHPVALPVEMSAIAKSGYSDDIAAALRKLTYDAQTNFQFASIYEQRRTTAVVFEGFRSLEDAVHRIGTEVRWGLDRLSSSIDEQMNAQNKTIQRHSDALEHHLDPNPMSHTIGGEVAKLNNTMKDLGSRLR